VALEEPEALLPGARAKVCAVEGLIAVTKTKKKTDTPRVQSCPTTHLIETLLKLRKLVVKQKYCAAATRV
jgi:hypothetical protein